MNFDESCTHLTLGQTSTDGGCGTKLNLWDPPLSVWGKLRGSTPLKKCQEHPWYRWDDPHVKAAFERLTGRSPFREDVREAPDDKKSRGVLQKTVLVSSPLCKVPDPQLFVKRHRRAPQHFVGPEIGNARKKTCENGGENVQTVMGKDRRAKTEAFSELWKELWTEIRELFAHKGRRLNFLSLRETVRNQLESETFWGEKRNFLVCNLNQPFPVNLGWKLSLEPNASKLKRVALKERSRSN